MQAVPIQILMVDDDAELMAAALLNNGVEPGLKTFEEDARRWNT